MRGQTYRFGKADNCVLGPAGEEACAVGHLRGGPRAHECNLHHAVRPLGVTSLDEPACSGTDVAQRRRGSSLRVRGRVYVLVTGDEGEDLHTSEMVENALVRPSPV